MKRANQSERGAELHSIWLLSFSFDREIKRGQLAASFRLQNNCRSKENVMDDSTRESNQRETKEQRDNSGRWSDEKGKQKQTKHWWRPMRGRRWTTRITEKQREKEKTDHPSGGTHRLYSAPRNKFSGFLQTLHSAAGRHRGQHWWWVTRTESTPSTLSALQTTPLHTGTWSLQLPDHQEQSLQTVAAAHCSLSY